MIVNGLGASIQSAEDNTHANACIYIHARTAACIDDDDDDG